MITELSADAAYIVAAKRDCTVCDGDGVKSSGANCGGCGATGLVYSYPDNVRRVAEAFLHSMEWQAPEAAPENQRVLVCWRGTNVLSAHTEIGVRHPLMGWKNNYGHLFSSAPDGWRPMPEPLQPNVPKQETSAGGNDGR